MFENALIFCTLSFVTCTTTPADVRAEIARQAARSAVKIETALRIADCESDFDAEAKNPKSTAVGVYQFLKGTWKVIGAKESRDDYKANIREFLKWYPKHPEWWRQCREKDLAYLK